MSHHAEKWKTISTLPGTYAVSSHGRIRREIGGFGARAGYILKQITNTKGYFRVCFGLGKKGFQRIEDVHRIVAREFFGPCPKGLQVHHIDANKRNNNVENLKYVTPLQNMREAAARGVFAGSKQAKAKLHELDIPIIRNLLKIKAPVADIAKRFGVGRTLIYKIKNGKNWTHV